MKTTIFIPTKNAGSNFENVLNAIFEQKEKNFEMLIIDSGSTDQTLEIIEKFPKIILKKIKPEEFGHAQTRNLAVQYSNSEYMVFLSQDAIPQNDYWLTELLSPFEKQIDENIVATFSKQIPYSSSKSDELFLYKNNFNDIPRINKKSENMKNYYFSNVSSCIKREILLKFPFDERVHFSEDRKFVLDIFDKGYKTYYNPNSIVIHSHNYNFNQMLMRYFDMSLSLRKIFKKQHKNLIKKMPKYILNELIFTSKNNPSQIFLVIKNNFIKTFGTILGIFHNKLPKKITVSLSTTPQFFKKEYIKEKKSEIVVYSCVTGKYDNLYKAILKSEIKKFEKEKIDFILFNDYLRPGFLETKNGTWEIRPLYKKFHDSNTKTARWHKINSHILFPKAKYTVWIDGTQSIHTHKSMKEIVLKSLRKNHIATFKHPKRPNIYREARECIRLMKDDSQKIKKQISKYRKDGYPIFNNSLVETTCIIRKNTRKMRAFNKEWWKQLDTNSIRDQLSFNYVAWKLNIEYSIIPGHRTRSYFLRHRNHHFNLLMFYKFLSHTGKFLKKRLPIIYKLLKPFFPDKII